MVDRLALLGRAALVFGVALGSPPLLATNARADCGTPPFELLWTYPANGAVDIPTNAVLHTLSTVWFTPRVTLDGVVLTAHPSEMPEGVSLGTLLPQHDYVLQLDYRDANVRNESELAARVQHISFRTGSGPASKPAAVAISSTGRAHAVSDSACPDVVAAQDCFDQGQNTLLTFDVPDASGPGYLVDGELWPARCGNPSLFVFEDANTARCHEVRVIGAGGLLSETTRICPAPVADAGADAAARVDADAAGATSHPAAAAAGPMVSGDACALSATTSARSLSAWSLLGVSSFLFTRRRRLRPRCVRARGPAR